MNVFLLRRYLFFVVSLFINALGVAFITRALLGTSPITSVTYVLSLFTSLTMGEWTIIVNVGFVFLELFLHDPQRSAHRSSDLPAPNPHLVLFRPVHRRGDEPALVG